MNIVVKNLSKLMQNKNISAYKFTKDLHLSNSAVTDWSKGKASPSRKTLLKICDYFSVPLSYFYQETELHEIYNQLTPDEQNEVMDFIKNKYPRFSN